MHGLAPLPSWHPTGNRSFCVFRAWLGALVYQSCVTDIGQPRTGITTTAKDGTVCL